MALTTFQESYYLQQNPDVLEAVRNGVFGSAEDHYTSFGEGEGRKPNPYFDPAGYLSQNTDVLSAVNAGVFSSGLQHYEMYGATEGRQPGADDLFDEAAYLAENPDVAEAVNSGAFHSGYEHFVVYGSSEGRSSGVTPPPVDGQTFTLTTNQDIFTGGAGTDVIRGVAGAAVGAQDQTTLNSSDILDGGAGEDTLVVNMTGGGNYQGGATVKNIETLQVGTNLGASNFDLNVNQGAYEVTGVETLVYDQITTGETLNLLNIVPVAADGGTPTLHWANEAGSRAGTAGATYRQASINGTDDDQAIQLSNVNAMNAGDGILNIGGGIESFTIESTGAVANNTLNNSGNTDGSVGGVYDVAADLISSGSLTKVVLTGDVAIGKVGTVVTDTTPAAAAGNRTSSQGLTDRAVGVDTGLTPDSTTNATESNLLSVGARVTEVDATEMTGAANVRFTAKRDGSATNVTFKGGEAGDYVEFELGNVSATGGAGDDTFAFINAGATSTFGEGDSIDGGEGSDTIQLGLNGNNQIYNVSESELRNKSGIDVVDLRGQTTNLTLSSDFVSKSDAGDSITVRTDKVVQSSNTNAVNTADWVNNGLENSTTNTINLTKLTSNQGVTFLGGSGSDRIILNDANFNVLQKLDGGKYVDSAVIAAGQTRFDTITVVTNGENVVIDAQDLSNVKDFEGLVLTKNSATATYNITLTEAFLLANTNGTNLANTASVDDTVFQIGTAAAANNAALGAGDTVRIDITDLLSNGALKTSLVGRGVDTTSLGAATVQWVVNGAVIATGSVPAGVLPFKADAAGRADVLGSAANAVAGGGGGAGGGLVPGGTVVPVAALTSTVGSAANENFTAAAGVTQATVNGGSGTDWFTFTDSKVAPIAVGSVPAAGAGVITLTNVEAVKLADGGNAGPVTINDASQLMTVVGGNGADVATLVSLAGGGGTISLGDGSDTLSIATNAAQVGTTYDGGQGNDIIRGVAANNTVNLSVSTITSFEQLDLVTNAAAYNYTLSVEQYNGFSAGIVGAGGNDTITLSNAGTVNVGLLQDTIQTYVASAAGNTITIGTNTAHTVTGAGGTDIITGGGGADSLSGGAGNDTIVTGGGADTVNGGAGVDTMTGTAAVDTYQFVAGDSSAIGATFDTITNWATGVDVIDFTAGALVLGGGDAVTAAAAGNANINAAGFATFNAADTTVAQRITAVAADLDAVPFAREVAAWQQGTDTYVYVSDGVAGVSANDVVIVLTGVTVTATGITLTGGDITAIA